MAITHAEFSRQASFLAKHGSDWAADVLTLPQEVGEPMRGEPVERFLRLMRERLSIIEAMHRKEAE